VNSLETLTRLREQRAAPKSPTGTKVPSPAPGAIPLLANHPSLRETFVVTHVEGLHARPCATLVRTLQHLQCTVTVQSGDYTTNGRSILGLLTLAAGCHSRVAFTITGRDAAQAMAAVRRLFQTSFADAYLK
jgi:phosphotransferase system HPr (HPr) family protein